MFNSDTTNRLIGAVDTINIASIDTVIPTIGGTYEPGDDSLLIGIFEGDDSFSDFIQSISETFVSGNIIVYNGIEYVYADSQWNAVTFYGNVAMLSDAPTTTEYMIVFDVDTNSYYTRIDDNWVTDSVVLFVYMTYIIGINDGE